MAEERTRRVEEVRQEQELTRQGCARLTNEDRDACADGDLGHLRAVSTDDGSREGDGVGLGGDADRRGDRRVEAESFTDYSVEVRQGVQFVAA